MKVYTVHIHPGDADPLENAILIREGFSFWAFLLSGIWALYHRLWLAFGALVVITILCNVLISVLDGGTLMDLALNIIISFGFGLIGNDLRRRKLAARGWKFADIVAAGSREEAEHRIFHHLRPKNDAAGPHAALASPQVGPASQTTYPSSGSIPFQ